MTDCSELQRKYDILHLAVVKAYEDSAYCYACDQHEHSSSCPLYVAAVYDPALD